MKKLNVMAPLTPMQRVLKTLSFEKADKIPLFLLLTTTGAKELNMSIEEYFSSPENVALAQIRMQKKYNNDCYYAFYYASLEIEAFGGSTLFKVDGSPNAGAPIIKEIEDIHKLKVPEIKSSKPLSKVLKTISILKEASAGNIPIIGVVMSPFSLPSMQMGFEKYFELMYYNSKSYDALMKINEKFCINYANAQLEAGANVICYFDPVASTTIVPRNTYKKTGFLSAQRVISKIKGPVVTHFASGNSLSISDLISETETKAVCVSDNEDIKEHLSFYHKKLAVIGNLNGIEMRNWTPKEASDNVKKLITYAGDSGFIISDNHGEIPFQISEETLLAISDAVKTFGTFPIK